MTTTIYQKKYDTLIKFAKNRADSRATAYKVINGYVHEHHIIPRCLGGSDTKDNYVYLSTKEHIRAHELLAEIYFWHDGLQHAADLLRQHFDITYEKKQNTEDKLTKTKLILILKNLIRKYKSEEYHNEYNLKKCIKELKHIQKLDEELNEISIKEKKLKRKIKKIPKNDNKKYSVIQNKLSEKQVIKKISEKQVIKKLSEKKFNRIKNKYSSNELIEIYSKKISNIEKNIKYFRKQNFFTKIEILYSCNLIQ